MVRFPEEKRYRNMTADEKLAHRRRLGRAASARYYAKHRESLNAKKIANYASSDKTRIQQYGRDYYIANRERLKARSLARYHANKAKKVDSVEDSEIKIVEGVKA